MCEIGKEYFEYLEYLNFEKCFATNGNWSSTLSFVYRDSKISTIGSPYRVLLHLPVDKNIRGGDRLLLRK